MNSIENEDEQTRCSPIRFPRFSNRTRPSRCPVCRKYSSKIKLYVYENDVSLNVLSCKCGTLFYPNAKAPDYELVENRNSFFMRIDQAEGIDSALFPLFSSPELSDYPVIDIGCGLGFTSEFIRFMGRECHAFDPSSAARLSTEILKIQIHKEYANPKNTKTGSNKLVFASEVIEHVERPEEFLAQLKEIAGSQGFLIVTTPNAEYVTNSNPKNTIMAMLAPSQHLFLLSKNSLSLLASQAGFEWVETWAVEEGLFLIAGPKKITLQNSFSRADYMNFLKFELSREDILNSIKMRSYGYRLFKEFVHAGEYQKANEIFSRIQNSYLHLGIDLNDPLLVAQKVKSASGQNALLPDPEFFPYNLALILYLKGTLYLAYNHDRVGAKPYFVAAIQIANQYRLIFTGDVFQAYDLELQSVAQWSLDQIKQHCL